MTSPLLLLHPALLAAGQLSSWKAQAGRLVVCEQVFHWLFDHMIWRVSDQANGAAAGCSCTAVQFLPCGV